MNDLINYINAFLARANISVWSVSDIQVEDIIDVLLVSYLIYTLIRWIQRTRAWSVFKGIMVIIILMGLSLVLQLKTVYWLISNTFSVGIIAIIVLFQPEMRKALEQIGRGGKVMGFFSASGSQEISRNTVTEVVAAAKAMAEVRTGAIIVLGQHMQLNDFENTGIAIDAVVTQQLLINIFEDKTPLHDGAVVIRDNRITAATCILPLTQEEIGKELGTRHRAAVGASELSDAHVLVVSEESGHISVAHGGRLERNLSEERIFQILLGGAAQKVKKGLDADE